MITISGYNILKNIHANNHSTIWRAIREEDQLPVILKVLNTDYPSPKELAQYHQEYNLLKTIEHQGVLKAYDLIYAGRQIFLVLEDFAGISLREYLQQRNNLPLDIETFLEYAIALVDALGEIHRHHIIHKDINPANLVLNPERKIIKIIDFGIATQLSQEQMAIANLNYLEGTLAYISPEQTGRMNQFLDYRTDFYSLGITFYKLLTGQSPFASEDPLEIIHYHLAKLATPPNVLVPEIPGVLSQLIMTLIAKDPDERYQTIFGILIDLQNCLKQLKNTQTIVDFPLQQQDHSSLFKIPQKLYGRQAQIAILMQALREVKNNQCTFAMISGYSGIGKSSLARVTQNFVLNQKGLFIQGKCDQFQRNIPYFPIISACQDLVQQLLGSNDLFIQKWCEKITNVMGKNLGLLIRVIPELKLFFNNHFVINNNNENFTDTLDIILQKFIQSLASEQLLVIFLDDLQWADNASLDFLKLLAKSSANHKIFVIGTYRDNEVYAAHPLLDSLGEVENSPTQLIALTLQNFNVDIIQTILVDTLKSTSQQVTELAIACYDKTQGNPFFLNQFLQYLYHNQYLVFDINTNQWQWDLDAIQNLQVTDNVVDFMVTQLQKVSPESQRIMGIAATIGNKFNLSELALITDAHRSTIATQLQPAIAEQFIIPQDNNYKIPLLLKNAKLEEEVPIKYRFAHDRVQQSAYLLLDQETQQAIHLKIARSLLHHNKIELANSNLFDCVNHFNLGRNLIEQTAELLQLVKLNFHASQEAKKSSAFKSAFDYIQQSIWLIETEPRVIEQIDHDFRLEIYQHGVDVAHLSLNFQAMEMWSEIAISIATNIFDQCKIYETKIQAYIAENRLNEAINLAFQAVEELGITLPLDDESIQQAIAKANVNIKSKSIETIQSLSAMEDPRILAAMKILGNVASAVYISRPELYPLVVITQVDLAVEYGTSGNAAYAFATYGLILCASGSDIEFGNQIGKLALTLLEKFQAIHLKAKIFNLVFPFIFTWKQHLRLSLKPLIAGYQSGVDNGDLEFAAYCIYNHCSFSYFVGQPLTEVLESMQIYGDAILKLGQDTAFNFHTIYWQSAANLAGKNDNPVLLKGAVYDETKMLLIHKQANDQYALVAAYTNKLILNYLFHDYQQAEQFSLEAQPYLNATMGYPLYVLYHFYTALNQLALYTQATPKAQQKILTLVEEYQSKLQVWASHAPMNFQHKVDLVAAEQARISGDLWQAAELYEQAIAGANQSEYIQEEALAYELAAHFYYQQDKRKIAQTYFRESHYLYNHWGAIAKAQHLEDCYPQFLSRKFSDSTLTQTSISSNGSQTNILDLNSVFKASQTLSSALKRETLLKQIMEIIIENAGAETGYLLRQNQDQWLVEARASTQERIPEILATYLTEMINSELPESVINYVARTEKKVLLNQANNQGDFTQDPYIQQAQIKSIFCFPLIYQGVMKAIIYLENKLLENAFTTDRLEILQLISTQAAISLENVNLYETLEQQVYERTEKLSTALEHLQQTQSQLIESEKMAALGNLVAGVAHEISTPIGTSITIASFFAQETTTFLKTCTTGQLKRSVLNEYLKIADESSKMLMGNLNRAGDLVNNFKQVAVDQTTLEKRTFNLKGYIHDLLGTLLPELRHRQITTVIIGDESIYITSYPGIFSQIITNLVMNSLKHAYHNQAPGNLTFRFEEKNNILYLKYNDDGCGISPEHLLRIFEPFFTTTRGRGGTGLGLHIVYNLVRQTLKGTITCHSQINQGTEFLLELPLELV